MSFPKDDSPRAQPRLPSPVPQRLLSTRERLVASVAGLLLGGGGTVSVFATENQAGSTALILMGALFVLLGIQGTPVTRASKDAVELSPRVDEITSKARELEIREPEAAEKFLEGAVSADPRLNWSPTIVGLSEDIYYRRVRHALERLASRQQMTLSPIDDQNYLEFDYDLYDTKRRVAMRISIRFEPVGPFIGLHRLENILSRPRFEPPILVVANVDLPERGYRAIQRRSDSGCLIRFVKWADGSDDDLLSKAIDSLIGAKIARDT